MGNDGTTDSKQEELNALDELLRLFATALRAPLAGAPETIRRELIDRVAQLTLQRVELERRRCVDICLRRGTIWKETSRKDSPLAPEARARANEALYLADLLETGEALPEIT